VPDFKKKSFSKSNSHTRSIRENGVRSEMQFGRGRYDQSGLFGCVGCESVGLWKICI